MTSPSSEHVDVVLLWRTETVGAALEVVEVVGGEHDGSVGFISFVDGEGDLHLLPPSTMMMLGAVMMAAAARKGIARPPEIDLAAGTVHTRETTDD